MIGVSGLFLTALGIVVIGFSAVGTLFLGTNKGEKWLNRVIDWAMEKCYTQDHYTREKSIIWALRQLELPYKDDVLTKREYLFEDILDIIENLDLDKFDDLNSEDEVVKLERVDRSDWGHDELKERGLPFSSANHIDAVMEDGSRKIVAGTKHLGTQKVLRKQDLGKQKERDKEQFRNRIEDGIKGSIIGIRVIGVLLSLAGIWLRWGV